MHTQRNLLVLGALTAVLVASASVLWQSHGPAPRPALASSASEVAAGGAHSCALDGEGGLSCWGFNSSGQVGDGTTTNRLTPVAVSGLSSGVSAVAAGGQHTCALTTGGGVKCWGRNSDGQLGDGTTTGRLTPVNVTGLASGVVAVEAGDTHTCALTTGGGVKCWGDNESGQLGDGTTTTRTTPVDVSGLTSGVSELASLGTSGHTCVLTTGGGVKCWGSNYSGQLGDGQVCGTDYCAAPVDVTGMTSGVSSVAVGGFHTCALTTGTGMKCWGYNVDGQVGDGTTTDRWTPVDVSGLTSGVSAITAGLNHTCALVGPGGAKCWGYNYNGQLGDGTTTTRLTPVDVSGLTSGAVSVSGGAVHTCAMLTASALKCWGNNSTGSIGDGQACGTLNCETPADVSGFGPKIPPTPTKQPAPGDTDGDGCPDVDENGPDEKLGGRRDYKSPWDYFNPTNDGENRVDDIVAVVQRYTGPVYHDPSGDPFTEPPPSPAYHPKFDRSYLGPEDWDLGPPDGYVLVDDILFVVRQYFHDCGTVRVKPTMTPTATPEP